MYLDDILLRGKNQQIVNYVKSALMSIFKLKDKGILKIFLGLEINYDQNKGKMSITQTKYIEKLLRKFGMLDCKTTSIPMDPNLKLIVNENNNDSCNM